MPKSKVPKDQKTRLQLDEIMSSVAEEAATPGPPSESDIDAREGVGWARDCYWVADHLDDRRMTRAKAGSSLRYAIHKFARANIDEFIKNMLPKAMTILERVREKSGDDTTVKAEQKSIKELKKILTLAVHEAVGTGEVDEVVDDAA